jgi:hypothetical protein
MLVVEALPGYVAAAREAGMLHFEAVFMTGLLVLVFEFACRCFLLATFFANLVTQHSEPS